MVTFHILSIVMLAEKCHNSLDPNLGHEFISVNIRMQRVHAATRVWFLRDESY